MSDLDRIRSARAYLCRVAEPPAVALAAFVDRHGAIAAAERVRAGQVPDAVADETSARRHLDTARADLTEAAAVDARLVVPEDAEWPAWQLLPMQAALGRGLAWAGSPLGLWVRGSARLDELLERAVSVVGARAATGYGEHVAAEFGYGLAGAQTTVVSGAAFGIDAAAHRGALHAGGPTVAVLGCGIDIAYPVGHTDLLTRIAAHGGAVVSEYPPGTRVARHRFLVRNRLIAAFGAGTVVVEAGLRSGARNTAASAAALGRTVMAVPGPITSQLSVGCVELLRGGALVVASPADVLEAVGPIGDHLAPGPQRPSRRTDGLGPQAMRVHEALQRGRGSSPESVATDSGVPLDRVRALLPELELTGHVVRGETGWRRAS